MAFGKGHHLHLIDGSAFIFRAYHALPPLTRKSDGLPVGAVSGFCNMLFPYITGQGGSELPDLKAEFNPMPHVRGTLSMARASEEDSANSQFFIVFYPRFSLDQNYTNFGRVIAGMDAVDAINRGEPPTNPTRIVQASLAVDNRPAPSPAQLASPPSEEISADDLNAPIGQ